MKRQLLLLVFSIVMAFGLFSQQNATDLFISEYCEWDPKETDPNTFNHYVELYNGTGAEVDLLKYQLWRARNGDGWGKDGDIVVGPFPLAGNLANNKTFVISRPMDDPDKPITISGDMSWSFMNISGDDAVGLAKDDGTGTFVLIDVIGEPDNDPGSGWQVGDTTIGTQNNTLIRKPDVCSPTSDWASSAGISTASSQWIVMAENDTTDIHKHTTQCSGTVNVFVNEVNNDLVYPVPNNGTFIYETEREQIINVVDITGRSVKSFRVNPGVNNVCLDLPTGMYLITTEKEKSTTRMLIKK